MLLPIKSLFFLKVLFCLFLTMGSCPTSALWSRLGWASSMLSIALGVDATGSQSGQLLFAAATEDDGLAADRNTFIGRGTRCSSAAGSESFSAISALVSSCLKL